MSIMSKSFGEQFVEARLRQRLNCEQIERLNNQNKLLDTQIEASIKAEEWCREKYVTIIPSNAGYTIVVTIDPLWQARLYMLPHNIHLPSLHEIPSWVWDMNDEDLVRQAVCLAELSGWGG